MNVFLDNAEKIFDVACSDAAGESTDFALMVRPDGGIHLVAESALSLDAAAAHVGALTAYRVTRLNGHVRVTGRQFESNIVLEKKRPDFGSRSLLRDQPLYRMTSPVLPSASV